MMLSSLVRLRICWEELKTGAHGRGHARSDVGFRHALGDDKNQRLGPVAVRRASGRDESGRRTDHRRRHHPRRPPKPGHDRARAFLSRRNDPLRPASIIVTPRKNPGTGALPSDEPSIGADRRLGQTRRIDHPQTAFSKRSRIGYSVPDESRATRMMSAPASSARTSSLNASRNARRTRKPCCESRRSGAA